MNWLKKIFGLKHKISNKVFCQAFQQYIYNQSAVGIHTENYLQFITDVTATQHKNRITLDVRSHRPGYFVGYHGENINGICKYISELMPKYEIVINVSEEKMFYW